MNDRSMEFLSRLIHAISPSGYEEDAARVWQEEARTFAASVKHDSHGNSHAVVNPGGSPRIMFAGHIDEIGFIISHIDDNGFLWIRPVGGWDAQIPQGQRVVIRARKGRVPGVIGKRPIHLIQAEDRNKMTRLESLWVDIGVKNRKHAEKYVEVGDPLVLDHGLGALQGEFLVGRGFDNRIGAFIVLEAARALSTMKIKAEIHAVATVQEELGIRGARTAAFGIDPLVGIATDVTFSTDYPSMDDAVRRVGKIRLGEGAVITRGPNIHPKLFNLMVDVAKKKKVPYQVEANCGATGTDANFIQVNRTGVITGLISVPNRYMHSPCEMIHAHDVESVIRLMAETSARIGPNTDFAIL